MWKVWMVQGWRNLRRNMRRTSITVFVVAVGLAMMILSYALVEGFVPQMIEGGARTLNGHILLHKKGYFQKKSLSLMIHHPERVRSILAKNPQIDVWSERLLVRGLLGSSEGVQGVQILGVIPAQDRKVISLYDKIQKGRAPRKTFQEQRASSRVIEALIGAKIAHKLKLGVGSKVVLKVGALDGTAVSEPMRISGIYQTGSPGFDSFYVVIHRDEVARLIGAKQGIHQFAVRVKKIDQVKHVTATLQNELESKLANKLVSHREKIEVLPWFKNAPELKAMVDMSSISIGVMLLFIFPIVLLGCLNTMLMSAYERSREIGILKALGSQRGQIISLFFWEAVFISVIGVCIGFVIGVSGSLYFEHSGGISMKPFMEDDNVKMMISGFAIDPVMWVRTTIPSVLIPSIMVTMSTILAAVYPAWKVSRMKPTEAIQFQS